MTSRVSFRRALWQAGVYFYADKLRDLRLAGRIEQGSRLLLDIDATVAASIRYSIRVTLVNGGAWFGADGRVTALSNF